jgi:hypothetical protein
MENVSPLPEKDQCAICKTTQGVTVCKGCLILHYCSAAHQKVDITALNKDYFNAIADPEEFRKMQPMYKPELPIVEVLSQTYEAWAETPGAFALWQELCMSWDSDVD